MVLQVLTGSPKGRETLLLVREGEIESWLRTRKSLGRSSGYKSGGEGTPTDVWNGGEGEVLTNVLTMSTARRRLTWNFSLRTLLNLGEISVYALVVKVQVLIFSGRLLPSP